MKELMSKIEKMRLIGKFFDSFGRYKECQNSLNDLDFSIEKLD